MIEELALRDSQVRLADGRTLAYAEYGAADGHPVLFFHGSPGGRLLHPRRIRAGAAGSRIIAVDRPGYGRSDFHTGWEMLDWANDMAALADALGLARFAVVGTSAGGVYAAACAHRLPARVTALGLVSCPAPLPVDRAGAQLLREGKAALDKEIVAARTLSWSEFQAWYEQAWGPPPSDVEQALAGIESVLAECERQVLAQPTVRESVRLELGEAFRQGLDGWGWDSWLLVRPWGFRLEDIAVPAYVWQCEQDPTGRLSGAQYLARTIPGCRAVYFPEEEHWIPPHYWKGILSTLVGDRNAG